jgi:NNP family nitrate/nitrite transporter-like MFS transporter
MKSLKKNIKIFQLLKNVFFACFWRMFWHLAQRMLSRTPSSFWMEPFFMANRLPLFNFSIPRIRILHYTWLAFFITFLIWFAHASLMPTLKEYFDLTDAQVKALLMLNVAITIPARILIGILVDKFGPRKSYSFLLLVCGFMCLLFAAAQTFEWLSIMRFLLGFVGAGFVIGIRLISEWFPAKEVGVAEGIYGGWGNFGAAVAAMSMPFIAHAVGGDDGWRYAVATTGVIAIIYSYFFYKGVRDTPEGSTYFKPAKAGGLEVTSNQILCCTAYLLHRCIWH